MDDRKLFFDSSASAWDTNQARDLRPERLAQVVDWFAVKEGDVILDVGTGTGVLLPFLRNATGDKGKLVAMDFSLNMLKMAMARSFKIPPAIINAGVAAIPLRNSSFDKVTCFSAFPHFPDKEKALAEIARVLKPGGTAFIAHLHSIEEIAKLHGTVGGAVQQDHLPDRKRMIQLMEKAGFSGVNIINEPGKFLAWGRKG